MATAGALKAENQPVFAKGKAQAQGKLMINPKPVVAKSTAQAQGTLINEKQAHVLTELKKSTKSGISTKANKAEEPEKAAVTAGETDFSENSLLGLDSTPPKPTKQPANTMPQQVAHGQSTLDHEVDISDENLTLFLRADIMALTKHDIAFFERAFSENLERGVRGHKAMKSKGECDKKCPACEANGHLHFIVGHGKVSSKWWEQGSGVLVVHGSLEPEMSNERKASTLLSATTFTTVHVTNTAAGKPNAKRRCRLVLYFGKGVAGGEPTLVDLLHSIIGQLVRASPYCPQSPRKVCYLLTFHLFEHRQVYTRSDWDDSTLKVLDRCLQRAKLDLEDGHHSDLIVGDLFNAFEDLVMRLPSWIDLLCALEAGPDCVAREPSEFESVVSWLIQLVHRRPQRLCRMKVFLTSPFTAPYSCLTGTDCLNLKVPRNSKDKRQFVVESDWPLK
jgi:hypothetical protein